MTGAGSTYMFCLLQSARLAEPPAPPSADKLPDSDALAAAFALASALDVEPLELLSVFVKVDGTEGVEGGVQVGQLVPPFLQVVANEAALARASTAATMRWVVFKVGFRGGNSLRYGMTLLMRYVTPPSTSV